MSVSKLKFRIIQKDFSSISTDKGFMIEGIANSGKQDLVGDTVTQNALQQIVDQAPQHNLHLDHDTTLDGVLGPIIKSELVEEGAYIKARILNEKREMVESLLNQDVRLGLSISGIADSTTEDKQLLDKWDLTEISLTPIPCDQATMGSVRIAKSLQDLFDEKSEEDEEEDDDTPTTNIEEETIVTGDGVEADEEETDESGKESDKSKEQNGDENMAEEEVTYTTADDVITLINTAFNEKQEEFLETIREEIKKENEAVVTVQEERINALEQAIEALKQEAPAPGEEEKAEDDEEEKPVPEEDEEEEEKSFDEQMTDYLKRLFGVEHEEPSFKYDESKNKESTDSKGATPREIARMLANK